MLVYTCTEGDQGTYSPWLGMSAPTCSSGGSWVDIDVNAYEGFDPSDLNPAHASAAFGSGFVLLGTGMVLAFAIKLIVRHITGA